MQQIVSLAKDADPIGRRTLGVVTKVDTLEDGTHEAWHDVFANTGPVRLALGYQFLRNPTQKELNDGISLEQAAANELEFFSTDPFFSSRRAPPAMADRCGVDALRGALSEVLVDLIHTELPEMRKAVDAALEKVRACMVSTACSARMPEAAWQCPASLRSCCLLNTALPVC